MRGSGAPMESPPRDSQPGAGTFRGFVQPCHIPSGVDDEWHKTAALPVACVNRLSDARFEKPLLMRHPRSGCHGEGNSTGAPLPRRSGAQFPAVPYYHNFAGSRQRARAWTAGPVVLTAAENVRDMPAVSARRKK